MKTQWKGRSALQLANDRVQMTMLTGGGHIASFSFTPNSGHTTENVIWESPWDSADPLTPELRTSVRSGGKPRSHVAWRGRDRQLDL
jgi:hypothetical protein